MAKAGMEIWAIQLFCRWGSDAVLGYVRDAPLHCSANIAARVASGLALGEVKTQMADTITGRYPRHAAAPEATNDLVEQIVERRLAVDQASINTVLEELRAEMADMGVTMATLISQYEHDDVHETEPRQTYVVFPSGTMHRVGSEADRTCCGLTWRSDEVFYLNEPSSEWAACRHACAQTTDV